MDVFPRQTDDIEQEALGQAVLAHDANCGRVASVSELQTAVRHESYQSVAFHARHSLRDGGSALA